MRDVDPSIFTPWPVKDRLTDYLERCAVDLLRRATAAVADWRATGSAEARGAVHAYSRAYRMHRRALIELGAWDE